MRASWVSVLGLCLSVWSAWEAGTLAAVRAAGSPVSWLSEGWFDMGSRQSEIDYARRLCVQERMPDALRLRGCAEELLFSDELGERRVYLRAFGIDRYEVTRAQYQRCVAQGSCSPSHEPEAQQAWTAPDHPASSLTWPQAGEVCDFRGGRLPTEAEWERAARGLSRRRFPWGRYYNERLANHGAPTMALDPLLGRPSAEDGFRHTSPVGAFPDGQSPAGAYDMAGNVWEWTADGYAPAEGPDEHIDPQGAGATGMRVVRGGSWRSPGFTLRVTQRAARPEGGHWVDVGVRCAYDVRRH